MRIQHIAGLLCATALFVPAAQGAATSATSTADAELTRAVAALDAKVFDAYNSCDLKTFEAYFLPSVEFYHDQGGVSYDSATVVANTRKNICGKVNRKLLPASLKVYPIRGYGAVEEGEHVFCMLDTGKCEGIAKFVMVWENKDGQWRMTRILSYGHREMTEADRKSLP